MAPSFSLALLLLALLQLVLSSPYNGAEVSPSGEDVHATWGPYSWLSLEAGKAESLRSGKPLLLLIWKTWCGACKSLRPKFAASSDIAAEAPGFVMVNVVDDEEPSDALYKPEGAGYSALRLLPVRAAAPLHVHSQPLPPALHPPPLSRICPVPRILFFSPSHKLMDITSGNAKFAYFYGDDASIAAAMQKAAAQLKLAADFEQPEEL